MIPTLIRKLRGSQGTYEKLVARVEAGEKVSDAEVIDALDGRKVEDFTADVRKLAARRTALADIKQADAMQGDVSAAEAAAREALEAVENHPLRRMVRELENLERRHHELRAAAKALGTRQGSIRGAARDVLFRTAPRSVFQATAAVSGQIRALQHDLAAIRLTDDEAAALAVALREVCDLPQQIAAAQNDQAAAVSLTARLHAQRTTCQRLNDRRKQAAEIAVRIAKLEGRMEQEGLKRMELTYMEFTSKPEEL